MCMQMHDMACGLLCLSSFASLNVFWFYFVLNHCCNFLLFTMPLAQISNFSTTRGFKNQFCRLVNYCSIVIIAQLLMLFYATLAVYIFFPSVTISL